MKKFKGSWGIVVTETFRWASGMSPMGVGFNLQTLPKQFRHYCLPPPGRVFGQPDLSQAEARIVAYLAQEEELIQLFNDPTRSVHMENAKRIFQRDVVKDSPEYVLAKATIHGGNYRLGPFKFALMTGLTPSEGKKILEMYHGLYPGIRRWHNDVKHQIETKGFLVSPFGDQRFFYEAVSCRSVTGKITDQQWKDGISWVPQTTVPRIIDRAMRGLREELPYLLFHHQGHDSFLVSLPPEKMQEVAEAMIRWLAVEIPIHGRTLVIPAEVQFGWNWGQMMNWKGNPFTQREWEEWRLAKYPPEKMKREILHGVYGPHLGDLLEEAMAA